MTQQYADSNNIALYRYHYAYYLNAAERRNEALTQLGMIDSSALTPELKQKTKDLLDLLPDENR